MADDGVKDFFDELDEADAFFDKLLTDVGVSPSAAAAVAAAPNTSAADVAGASSSAAAPSPPVAGAAVVFNMDDDDDAVEAEVDHSDARDANGMPTLGEPPADFTSEDLALRQVLADFYFHRRADNIANIDKIVKNYRGRLVPHLWAQLALKYQLPPHEAVEMLTKTIYMSAPLEYSDPARQEAIETTVSSLQNSSERCSRAELFKRALARGAEDGDDGALRALCFRGSPDEQEAPGLRREVWQVLLGYLPMQRHSDWNAIRGEKRALYAQYRSELLEVDSRSAGDASAGEGDDRSLNLVVKAGSHRAGELQEAQSLLQEVINDVVRTRRDFEYFRKIETQRILASILFIYARLNPGVRYVQGMNELAAVILFVMSSDAEFAEADSFWCFSELMAEIKDIFMNELDHSSHGVHASVEAVAVLLERYDLELALHLQKHDLPPIVFALRWCTCLFAQDATLPDVVRLWDSLIADPQRFQLSSNFSLAMVLTSREELLRTQNFMAMAELLQSAPRNCQFETELRRSFAICAFERREQMPPFPRSASGLSDFAKWAQDAASKAAGVGAEGLAPALAAAASSIQEAQQTYAPIVAEKATAASTAASAAAASAAAAAAAGASSAATAWEESAPQRQIAMEKAQTHFSSLWGSVRATGLVAMASAQSLAAEHLAPETLNTASANLTKAGAAASSAATAVYQRAASMSADGEAPPGEAASGEPQAGASDTADDGPPALVPVAAANPAPAPAPVQAAAATTPAVS